MWRPRNETKADRERQEKARSILEASWGCEIGDLSPALYHIDWCFRRGDIIHAFGEFKYRRASYPEMMLGLSKFQKMRELGGALGLPVFMFYQFSGGDEIYFMDVRAAEFPRIAWGGNDRGQNGDKEPVVMLPLSDMRILGERNANRK